MSPSLTPIFALPYALSGESISEQMERVRYSTIDLQLESLFKFLGDGIVSGLDIVPSSTDPQSVVVLSGAAIAGGMAVATNVSNTFKLSNVAGQTSTINYFYLSLLPGSPSTAAGSIVGVSTLYDDPSYLPLGTVTVSSNWKITIDTSASSGRKQLTILKYLLESLATHLHTGQASRPSKIDLTQHVAGILSSAQISDLPASKIASGVISKDRFSISHNDLNDIGTLTHSELDGLIEKFQGVNALLFGDLLSSNLMQLVLSLKHVWGDVDQYFNNFFTVAPGIGNNSEGNPDSFIDAGFYIASGFSGISGYHGFSGYSGYSGYVISAGDYAVSGFNGFSGYSGFSGFSGYSGFKGIGDTTAIIDYDNHRISGKYVESKEIGQYIINSVQEFSFYDSKYITVNTNIGNSYSYGYGYNNGTLNYFDVLQALEPDGLLVGFEGDLDGYAFSSLIGGYGYGFEHSYDFANTLYSTYVTLVSTSSSTKIHDIDLGDSYAINPVDNSFPVNYYPEDAIPPEQFKFLMQIADQSDFKNIRNSSIAQNTENHGNLYPFKSYFYVEDSLSKVGSDQASVFINWQNALNLTSDNNIYFKLSQVLYTAIRDESDVWTFPVRPNATYVNTFDPYWSPDVSMDLIIEVTVTVSGEKYRHFYKYVDPSGLRFVDFTDNTIFGSGNIEQVASDVNPATALKTASISYDKLAEIKSSITNASGGYHVPSVPGLEEVDYNTYILTGTHTLDPTSGNAATILSNVTGIYLYTVNDFDGSGTANHYGFSWAEDAGPILFPMGQRNTIGNDNLKENESLYLSYQDDNFSKFNIPTMLLPYPSDDSGSKGSKTIERVLDLTRYRESKMLVDLAGIFLSTQYGYRYNEVLNVVGPLVISFPDTVDFSSISWISSEPSNSIVYLQIKRLSTGNGDEEDSDYNSEVIYTNKGIDLTAAQANSVLRPGRDAWVSETASMMPSGSDFPSEYSGIRSFAIRVVLLPSSDRKIAPELNSITVNYTSNTAYGSLHISTKDQWANYLSISNIVPKVESAVDFMTLDVPSSDDTSGKIKNLIYGTKKAVVEHSNTLNSWGGIVKKYLGDGTDGKPALPSTYYQALNGGRGIAGYVTCVKKLKNGDIVFLDQYAENTGSRIIRLDKSYNVLDIYLSEPALKNTDDTIPGISDNAGLFKAVYNSSVGEYGVVYLVFTHELKCYQDMYAITAEKLEDGTYKPQLTVGSRNQTVDLTQIKISFKGTTLDFSSCTDVIPCGRNTLCLVLDQTLQNFIESLANPEIRVNFAATFDATLKKYILQPVLNGTSLTGSCVTFFGTNMWGHYGNAVVPIEEPAYNVVYLPIEGTVYFDVNDDSDVFYILKSARPYSATLDGSFYPDEPWYVSWNYSSFWRGWNESTKNYQSAIPSVFPEPAMYRTGSWSPNFFLNSLYGYRGSIQAKGDYLLISIGGDVDAYGNKNGVLVFKKTASGKYGVPGEPYLISSDLYPMSAKFDEATYDSANGLYGDIYIALSDLKVSSGGSYGTSKVVKVRDTLSDKVVWQFGSEEVYRAGTGGVKEFIITANDVFALSYKKGGEDAIGESDVEVIVST